MDAMQYGLALDRILQEILVSNPKYGPVQLIKTDLSDGFYRVNLQFEDIPKLALGFPLVDGMPPLVALPLCLPMGWKLSPPHYCAVTETIANITNVRLNKGSKEHELHKLDERANAIKVDKTSLNIERDTNLPALDKPQVMTEIFVDHFLLLAQSNAETLSRLRSTLFGVIDEVFRANDSLDETNFIQKIGSR